MDQVRSKIDSKLREFAEKDFDDIPARSIIELKPGLKIKSTLLVYSALEFGKEIGLVVPTDQKDVFRFCSSSPMSKKFNSEKKKKIGEDLTSVSDTSTPPKVRVVKKSSLKSTKSFDECNEHSRKASRKDISVGTQVTSKSSLASKKKEQKERFVSEKPRKVKPKSSRVADDVSETSEVPRSIHKTAERKKNLIYEDPSKKGLKVRVRRRKSDTETRETARSAERRLRAIEEASQENRKMRSRESSWIQEDRSFKSKITQSVPKKKTYWNPKIPVFER